MTVVASDAFNRADNAASLGSADTGQAWSALSGTFGIVSNQAKITGAGGEAVAVVDAGVSDCTVQATVIGSADQWALVLRAQDAAHALFLYCNNSDTIKLLAFGGTAGTLTVATGLAISSGSVIKAVLSGSSITVYLNGVQQGSPLTVTDFQAATKFGIGCVAPASAIFDDFSVTTAGAPTGVTATASGTLALAGSAAAAVAVQAAAQGALALSGSAQVAVQVHASAVGALTLAGSASAAVRVQATATGTLLLTGSATVGTPAIHATASGTLSLAGSASATVHVIATATGTLALGGSAAAAVRTQASAAGTLTLAGSASAGVLVSAQAAGAFTLSGMATAFHPGLIVPLDTLIFGALTPVPSLQFGALTPVPPALTFGPLTPA